MAAYTGHAQRQHERVALTPENPPRRHKAMADVGLKSAGTEEAEKGIDAFKLEKYDEAVIHLKAAVAHSPQRYDWQEVLALARYNLTARVDIPVPPHHIHTEAELMTPAGAPKEPLPAVAPPRAR